MMQEDLEKKKAECAEKAKNKIAFIHKQAEEKKAIVEAKRGEDVLKAEEKAAKYRSTGFAPKKILGFIFGWKLSLNILLCSNLCTRSCAFAASVRVLC